MGYKILIVGQWFVSEDAGKIIIPGGTERYVYGLAKQLQDDGYDVMVLAATTNKGKTGFNVLDGLSVYTFKVTEKLYGYTVDILSFIYTLKFIRRFDPDVVHVIASRYRFAVGAIAAAKIMKVGTVYTRTTLPHSEGRRRLPVLLDDWVFTKIIKRVDVIISLSMEMSEILTQQFNPHKMVIIPNPPVANYYKKMAKERNSILFVGRLEIATKGIDLLIKALHHVQMEIPDVKLHVCGRSDDSSLNYLLKLVSKYKLEKNILFHGHLGDDELVDKYSSSEVIVLPSLKEGAVSYVLTEAMSAGLPIITFDIGPNIEALDGGKYGILVKRGDVKSLADKIVELLRNEAQRIYYSRMSLERSKKYLQERVVRRIEEVYSDLLEGTC
jgi:glycosyltransferase involved in cell wall biosynthesis